jgi:hypothetical protein
MRTMKTIRAIGAGALLIAVAAPSLAAPSTDILWLSDTPPKRVRAAGHNHDNMDGVMSGDEGDGFHSGAKHLWLRQGEDPARATYLKEAALSSPISVLDTRGTRSRVAPAPMGGLAHARFELGEMGFYNAYLVRESVQGDTLRVQLAKAEMLKGTCCQKDIDPARTRAISDPDQPLELVREHLPDEKLSPPSRWPWWTRQEGLPASTSPLPAASFTRTPGKPSSNCSPASMWGGRRCAT